MEYEDHVRTCADCGAALVADIELARAGITPPDPKEEPRGYREPAVLAAAEEEQASRARAARVDVLTGACFLALGLMLAFATSYLALLPVGYGVVRLLRGLDRR